MSEIHKDRELEHLESMLYTYKVENKSMDTENERLKQEIRRIIDERDRTFASMLARAEKAEAENAKLRSALEELIWYTNQLELDVYDPKEWPDEHSAVTQARAALGGDT